MSQEMISIIEAGEYEYYGLRAHRGAAPAEIGQSLGNSRVWVDGDCTDDELDGISAIRVRAGDDIAAVIARLRSEYCWADEAIVLVGGYSASHGQDRGEIIILDNICLAILGV